MAASFFPNMPEGAEFNTELLEQLRELWVEHFREKRLSDYATTCRIVYATKESIHTANLGDGGTILVTADSVLSYSYKRGERFNNETESLSEAQAHWEIRSYPAKLVRAIYMMTDGIYEDIDVDARDQFAMDLYETFLRSSARKAHRDMQKILRIWNGSGDDKTITALYTRKEGFGHE